MPDTEADQMARALKALAHPIRLQIMNMLRQVEGKLCVCEIEGAFEIKQPTVSHHLKILREAGLVDAEQRGLYQYYRIKNEAVSYLRTQLRALER